MSDSLILPEPREPYVETCQLRLNFTAREASNDKLQSVANIRRYLYRQLEIEPQRNPDLPDYGLHDYLHGLIAEHLQESDFPYFVTHYRESEGSLDAVIEIAAIVVDGVAGYGALTAGLVAIHETFQGISKHAPRLLVTVTRKRGNPKPLSKSRKEPSLYPEDDSDTPLD